MALIKSVRDNIRTLGYGCVSSGKTHATAGVVLWFLVAFAPTARAFTIAPTERQLKINLWNEIPKMHAAARVPLGGDCVTLKLTMSEGWYAMGFSPKDKMAVFGLHGEHDLIVVDDAQGIEPDIWDGLENAMAGGTTKLLATCNPVVTSGEVFEVISGRRKGWNILAITADDKDPRLGRQPGIFLAPNVAAGRVVVPGTITREVRDLWIDKFGYDSDFVRTKVRALLPKQEPDTLVPLDWLEMATFRDVPEGDFYCPTCTERFPDRKHAEKHEMQTEHPVYPWVVLGADVARFGDDRSAIAPRRSRRVLEPIVLQGNDTMQVAGRVALAMDEFHAAGANIDVIGVGAGVVDRLSELGYNVTPVNVGEGATEAKFERLRDEVWWAAREALDPKNPMAIAIPRNQDLLGELGAPKWTTTSAGKIRVESKDSLKKRIGRSPDLADAVCLALFEGGSHQPGIWMDE